MRVCGVACVTPEALRGGPGSEEKTGGVLVDRPARSPCVTPRESPEGTNPPPQVADCAGGNGGRRIEFHRGGRDGGAIASPPLPSKGDGRRTFWIHARRLPKDAMGRNGGRDARLLDHLVSVIMPAYNEGHHIRRNLEETLRLLNRVKCPFEIIVVDDGSDDSTPREVLRVREGEERVVLATHPRNLGKGAALRTGVSMARGDLVVFLDSDLDLHPRQLIMLFRRMRDSRADVVVGSKWHPASRIRYPLQRKIISHIYRALLWILFGLPLRDTQTGLKIFRHEVLARTFPRLLCKRYALDVELLANIHRLGYRIIEAPVVLEFRRGNHLGRIGMEDLLRTGVDTLAIFYRMYIRRYYDAARRERAVAVLPIAPAIPASEASPLPRSP